MTKFLRTAFLGIAAAAAFISGCSTGGHYAGDTIGGPGEADWQDTTKQSRDPLLDAPYRAQMTCRTERPVTVLQRVKEVPFACSDIGVSATIDEIRDAGWRILSLNIGEDQEYENHVGFIVTIDVRKLF